MAITTLTSITEIVNSEWIDTRIGDYLMDAMVITPLARVANLVGKATKVAAFPRWIKDSGADITTEGTTTYTAVELETTEATATAAEVGIVRELTETARATAMIGELGLEEFVARDGGRLCAEMLEDDLAALFASITASVGTSGSNLGVAEMFEALGKRRTNNSGNSGGSAVFVLDDQQMTDLVVSVTSATASLLSGGNGVNGLVTGDQQNSDVKDFFGHPVYFSNLTDTANTGADVVGACLNYDPGEIMSTLGIAVVWMPRLKTAPNITISTDYYKISANWGSTLAYDATAVKLVTDA